MAKNTYTVDATTIDSNGVIVPKDLANELASHEFSTRSIKSEWAIKVVNDADESVDAQALVTTSDDVESFDEYAENGGTETAATGSPPDNVAYLTGDVVAAAIAVELTAATTPTTETVTGVFNTRLTGGA
jgi:hypothetical protein